MESKPQDASACISTSILRQELDAFATRLREILQEELRPLQASCQQRRGQPALGELRTRTGKGASLAELVSGATEEKEDHEWMTRPWYSHFYAGHWQPEEAALTSLGTPKSSESTKHPRLFHRPEIPGERNTRKKKAMTIQTVSDASTDVSPKILRESATSDSEGMPRVLPPRAPISDASGNVAAQHSPLQTLVLSPHPPRGNHPLFSNPRTPASVPAFPRQALGTPCGSIGIGGSIDTPKSALGDTIRSNVDSFSSSFSGKNDDDSLFRNYSSRSYNQNTKPATTPSRRRITHRELAIEETPDVDEISDLGQDFTSPVVKHDDASDSPADQAVGKGMRTLRLQLHPELVEAAGDNSEHPVKGRYEQWHPSSLSSLVQHESFDYCTGVIILASAVFMGIRSDYALAHVNEKEPFVFRSVAIVLCAMLVFELSARIWVYRGEFFRRRDDKRKWDLWNVFDFTVVTGSVVAEFLEAFDRGWYPMGLLYLRSLRLLRVVRIIRLMRVVCYIEQLRVLIASVAGTMKSLGWTLFLISLMMYIVGVHIIQVIYDEARVNNSILSPGSPLDTFFGSLARTLLSLFQAITGGVDWDDLVRPLIEDVSPLFGFTFALYIAFAVLAMMNVITGVFVESSLTNTKLEDDVDMMINLRELFESIDFGGTGHITWEQFRSCDTPQMDMYFKAVDLDPHEAGGLFKLLDLDESGTISVDEFVMGCLRLRGPAKAIDLATLMYDTRKANQRWTRAVERLQRTLELWVAYEYGDSGEVSVL